MKKYRKNPLIIEAEQWFPHKEIPGVTMKRYGEAKIIDEKINWDRIPVIETLEGDMNVSEGDWVIKGIEGEYYPCKDSIFRKTYEEVE